MFNFCNFCNEPIINEIENIDIIYYLQNYIDPRELKNKELVEKIQKIHEELLNKLNKKKRKVTFYAIVQVILIPNRHEEKYYNFINELENLKNKHFINNNKKIY